MKITTEFIRKQFINFFVDNDHLKIGSSSLLPANDPTLLFINSGMAPLKSYFLGLETPPSPRLVNVQPCIRTKDIEDVGDRHHLTLFEMLGSWSIGDYYKTKAVELAFDLLVNYFKIPTSKLYVTVYKGNDKLPPDSESARAWEKVGIPKDRIIALGDDNFWGPAGVTGPCGPCTEVFYDCGEAFGPAYVPGEEFDTTKRYIEIWNAGVFMEFNKEKDGSFSNLPIKSVDTGSGLERMAMVLNGLEDVYQTDALASLLQKIEQSIPQDHRVDHKIKMITDHMRASVFIMADGVLPGQDGRGYIPRRLLRKVIAGLVTSNVKNIELNDYINHTIDQFKDFYPHLHKSRDLVLHNASNEVNDFLPFLKKGLIKIDQELSQLKGNTFSPQKAFDLVTTHGIPMDVVTSVLKNKGVSVSQEKYQEFMNEHKKKSRVLSSAQKGNTQGQDFEKLLTNLTSTHFSGYERSEDSGKVLGIVHNNKLTDKISGINDFFLIVDQTPFYAESGGQQGDTGVISGKTAHGSVVDTQKVGPIHVHQISSFKGSLKKGDKLTLSIDNKRRQAIKRAHSATHLLHCILHKVLGPHANQKGSLVRPDSLRFDFQNNSKLSHDQLIDIENQVVELILDNHQREEKIQSYDQAIESGAMALFGEKYESKVRVISFGPNSVELCGGTHLNSSSEVGQFVIVSEGSVAKGIRRIEALTGTLAHEYLTQKRNILNKSVNLLKVTDVNIPETIESLLKKLKEKSNKKGDINIQNEHIIKNDFYIGHINGDQKTLKAKGDELINQKFKLVCLLAGDEKKVSIFIWSKEKTIPAGQILKKILEPFGGRGGGKPNFAQGGLPKMVSFNEFLSICEKVY